MPRFSLWMDGDVKLEVEIFKDLPLPDLRPTQLKIKKRKIEKFTHRCLCYYEESIEMEWITWSPFRKEKGLVAKLAKNRKIFWKTSSANIWLWSEIREKPSLCLEVEKVCKLAEDTDIFATLQHLKKRGEFPDCQLKGGEELQSRISVCNVRYC